MGEVLSEGWEVEGDDDGDDSGEEEMRMGEFIVDKC